jgi:hypothetical protein
MNQPLLLLPLLPLLLLLLLLLLTYPLQVVLQSQYNERADIW